MNNGPLEIEKLIVTIKKLRGENGCPWDQRQTPSSLKKYLREEVDELISAIDNNDVDNISEEIGDILYVLIMISDIYCDKGDFSFNDCINSINEKLIRRHPHVFAGKSINNEEDLRKQWENIKKAEKQRNN